MRTTHSHIRMYMYIRSQAEWAFKLYDFNNDHFIDERDINQLLIILMGDKLEKDFRHRIVAEVLNESDLDGNKKLTRYGTNTHAVTHSLQLL